MKIILSGRQFKILLEQNYQTGAGTYYGTYGYDKEGKTEWTKLDRHTKNVILGIGSAFIPVVGPLISAGIGLMDAKLYYDEGDKTAAGLSAAFSLLPFVGSIVSKIPGIKKLGTKGMSLLASKISKGQSLTKAEAEIANALKLSQPHIQKELAKMAPKIKSIIKELELYKPNYIKKYGEREYNLELVRFLYDNNKNAKITFINKLKNIKAPNIKVKPVLGGGADHRVFASVLNPNVVFKAELRHGEVDKWYETFRKYPNVFVKTIKKTKVKDKDGTLLNAVVMEKVDTKKFETFWDSLENILQQIPKHERTTLEYTAKHIDQSEYLKLLNQVLNLSRKQLPSMKNKINEFSEIITQLYKITPNPDIRKFNFGYDANGVLKALDL
jgi:hypothetical protein